MSRAALIVGIDTYESHDNLIGCTNDARNLGKILGRNEDGSQNFECDLLVSTPGQQVTSAKLSNRIKRLFASELDVAFFYFAGHGAYEADGQRSFLLGSDARSPNDGIRVDDVLELANKAYPRIKSLIIAIDSCFSGAGRNSPTTSSVIGNGVTILTSSADEQAADETQLGGQFTRLMIDALQGGGADLLGRVTAASIYAHIDQSMGSLGQRPTYRANISRFVSIRQCKPRLERDNLVQIRTFFSDPDSEYPLDPSYEPNRDNVPKEIMTIPPNRKKTERFEILQKLNRQGLVVPVNAEHMYYAAIESKHCKLTELGKHYWKLVDREKI